MSTPTDNGYPFSSDLRSRGLGITFQTYVPRSLQRLIVGPFFLLSMAWQIDDRRRVFFWLGSVFLLLWLVCLSLPLFLVNLLLLPVWRLIHRKRDHRSL